jgi:glycosyltransferase involved in cell wall biosynthesis
LETNKPHVFNYVFINAGRYSRNVSAQRVFWNLKFSLKAFYLLAIKVKSGDIVLCASRPNELIFLVSLLSWKKARLILDVRDIWPDSLPKNSFAARLWHSYNNLLIQRSIKRFHKAVYVAPRFLEWIQSRGNILQPTTYFIPLGIDNQIYNSEVKTIEWSKKLNFLYCGSLTTQFDIRQTILALSQGRYSFSLFGDSGNGEFYSEIKEWISDIEEMKISNILSREELIKEYNSAHIAVITMIAGALPNKFFDALGTCTPILAIGDGDVANMVIQHNIGWVVTENEASHISEVINGINRLDYNECIKNIKNIRSNYSRDLQTLKLKNTILG